MIYDDIKTFNQQFVWTPKIEGGAKLKKKFERAYVCGMGGSHLAADLLSAWKPELPLAVWHDYGLPPLSKKDLKTSLIIVSSYSGNTEETLAALAAARKAKLDLVVITSGGKLLEIAKKMKLPLIALPPIHEQPRMALGYSAKAMLCAMGDAKSMKEISLVAQELRPEEQEELGRSLARHLNGNIPLIYASLRNAGIAMNWKIVLNETGKIPAFWNAFPELNHNEMTGFDVKRSTRELSDRFHVILLSDDADGSQIMKRMRVLQGLYRDRGLKVEVVPMKGRSRAGTVFGSVNLAQWVAFFTAQNYGLEPEAVPMVEEFKKLIG